MITENNKWGMAWDMDDVQFILETDGIFEGAGPAADVQEDTWTHVMEVSLSGTTNGVLFINGVAVALSRGVDPNGNMRSFGYDTGPKNEDRTATLDPEPLFVGASDIDGDGTYENFFEGEVDNITMFLWGDNSAQTGTPAGQDWGTFNLMEDNEFIADTYNGIAGDLDQNGVLDQADVDIFESNWKSEKWLLDSLEIGDWETFQKGDMDMDGDVDIFDLAQFRQALQDGGFSNPQFALVDVPEPATLSLIGLGGLAMLRRRSRQATRRMKSVTSKMTFGVMLLMIGLMSTATLNAAAVTWGTMEEFDAEADIDLSYGNVIYAVNAGNAVDVTIGSTSILFETGNTQSHVDLPAGRSLYEDLAPAPNNSIYNGPSTGNLELDKVNYSHSWMVGGEGTTFTISFNQLNIGQNYKIQLFSPADTRGCCMDRTATIDDGEGNSVGGFARSADLDGDTVRSAITVVGSFTATAGSQLVNIVADAGFTDAGFSGLLLTSDQAFLSVPTLEINRDTGEMVLGNTTNGSVAFGAYSLDSNAGALSGGEWDAISEGDGDWRVLSQTNENMAEWSPLTDASIAQGQTLSLGQVWQKSPIEDITMDIVLSDNSVISASVLGEAYLQGDTAWAPTDSVSLGKGFTPDGTKDLKFLYRLANGNILPGVVEYVTGGVILGDVNGDGLVNGFDVDPFVDVLLNGPYQAEADVNEDGSVNGFDVDPFVALVLGGGSSPQGTQVPEPATLMLVGIGSLAALRRRHA